MEKEQIQDLAVQYATEGLDAKQKVVYDAWVISASDEEQRLFSEMVDTCAEVTTAAVVSKSKVEISPQVKTDILVQVDPDEDLEVKVIRKADQEWMNLPVKGTKWLELSARKQDGFVMSIIDVKPGSEFPAHEHHGVEMAYILEGDLEADGVMLNAGDFFRADAGTHHGKHFSPSGCQALIVTASENYKHRSMKVLGGVQKAYRKMKSVFSH